MKTHIIEIEDDYIGGQDPMTADEEKALSVFFAKKKQQSQEEKRAIGRRSSRKTKEIV